MSRRYAVRPGAWSESEHHQLRELYPRRRTPEVARLLGRSIKSVRSRAKILGLHKNADNGRHLPWTADDDELLRRVYPHISTVKVARQLGRTVISTYHHAFILGLHKTERYLNSVDACRLRRGDNVGLGHRFPKGHAPANKGLRRPGWFRGRMRETQFKKGQLPRNTMPLWTFRLNTDGYLLLKTGRRGPKPNDRWEFVHRLIWEQANGPIPEGYRIWWKDGDRLNCSLSNLEMLSGAEHIARTTVQNLPPELRQVIQLAGALKRKINNRERKRNGEEHIAGLARPPICDARSAV